MTDGADLSLADLRAVTDFAAACARPALAAFERDRPGDPRPRKAIEVAEAFAAGAPRTKALRDAAWAALAAAREVGEAGQGAAAEAARAAMAAAGAAFLHPLARPSQVKHILGSAAHAARAFELDMGGEPATGRDHIARTAALASSDVADVLNRYPPAPSGGGRVGELIRALDAMLRPTFGSGPD